MYFSVTIHNETSLACDCVRQTKILKPHCHCQHQLALIHTRIGFYVDECVLMLLGNILNGTADLHFSELHSIEMRGKFPKIHKSNDFQLQIMYIFILKRIKSESLIRTSQINCVVRINICLL